MPRIPNEKIEANSAQILNAIRNDAGQSYQDVVPVAYSAGDTVGGQTITKEQALARLREIGQSLQTYQPAQNAFITALVNRIGRVMLSNRLYENPWRGFKKGYLEYGETVEEIFVNLTSAFQFDPDTAEETVFRRNIPDVLAQFHTRNYQKFYKVTTSNAELKAAFLSFDGVNSFITKIIESVYTSANYDEFIMMKYMVDWALVNGRMAPVSIPTMNAANANSVVTTMKNMSDSVQFMSTQYNYAGVPTYTDKRYQYFLLTTEFTSINDVEVLARAFNLDKVEFMGNTVMVDSFTLNTLEEKRLLSILYPDAATRPSALFTDAQKTAIASVPACMVDINWFMIFDNFENFESIRNPEGLYWNHFYHTWKTFSTSPFATAIAFTTATSGITSVTVSPATITAPKGSSIPFTAAVVTTGLATGTVTWSVNSTLSSIGENGVLNISGKETAATLTVTATSTFDTTKTGTATVTISTTA